MGGCSETHVDELDDEDHCVVIPFTKNCVGGALVLHEAGMVMDLHTGDMVLLSVQLTHFNLHFQGIRASLVFHTDKSLKLWDRFNGWDGHRAFPNRKVREWAVFHRVFRWAGRSLLTATFAFLRGIGDAVLIVPQQPHGTRACLTGQCRQRGRDSYHLRRLCPERVRGRGYARVTDARVPHRLTDIGSALLTVPGGPTPHPPPPPSWEARDRRMTTRVRGASYITVLLPYRRPAFHDAAIVDYTRALGIRIFRHRPPALGSALDSTASDLDSIPLFQPHLITSDAPTSISIFTSKLPLS
ncbi:hypothetical protein C8J57DRAFT_1713191 [Mycena rebaudengoi]|nr:hypothetical protein C8J57DRAFT_1713191 [Mycena rebaudengoi]